MGDTRKKGHMIPMSFDVMKIFENAGFKLKELIIKRQELQATRNLIVLNIIFYLMPMNIFLFLENKKTKI